MKACQYLKNCLFMIGRRKKEKRVFFFGVGCVGGRVGWEEGGEGFGMTDKKKCKSEEASFFFENVNFYWQFVW